MKIIRAQVYYVEHNGEKYRTTDGKNWEVAMGESWEPEYLEDSELSRVFSAEMHTTPVPTIAKPPNQIAQEIADEFFMPSSLLHAKLRRLIMNALEGFSRYERH